MPTTLSLPRSRRGRSIEAPAGKRGTSCERGFSMFDCNKGTINRRQFLGGAAVASASVAGLVTYPKGQALADQAEQEWDYVVDASALEGAADDVDVVIGGSGLAGLCCAVECANAGLSVILVESETYWGGASAGAEGIICLHSDILEELGENDRYDTEEVLQGEYAASQYAANYTHLSNFVHSIDENYSWLVEECGVEFDGAEHFNPCQHFYKGGGQTMIETMVEHAKAVGVDCRIETRLRSAVMDDGRAVGAIVEDAQGQHAIKAKAVVLATGCFLKDSGLVSKLFPWVNQDRIVIMASGGNYGDGQKIAWAAGGDNHGICTPQLYDPILKSFFFSTHISVAGCNTPYFMVNENGKRFCREDLTIRYSEICLAILSQRRCIQILTQSAVNRMVNEGCPVGWAAYVKTGSKLVDLPAQLEEAVAEEPEGFWYADSLEELAEKTGLPVDNLTESVERYRELVSKGSDDDFGKDPQYLWEFPEGERLYAFELCAWFGNAMGGMVVSEDMQVISETGTAVPGLFAAGAGCFGPTGFVYSSDYPSTKQGWCAFTGRQAARKIVAELSE